jgi:hypothetical protein
LISENARVRAFSKLGTDFCESAIYTVVPERKHRSLIGRRNSGRRYEL